MAYDEKLAERIRTLVADVPGVTERKMFGGLAFLVDGNMAITASGQGGVMVRVDPLTYDSLVADGTAHPAEMRGRPMRGWVQIEADAVRTKRQLGRWVELGVAAVQALPAKVTDG
jgi:TfoX/Sxy family transcriptional regulator of competence genes